MADRYVEGAVVVIKTTSTTREQRIAGFTGLISSEESDGCLCVAIHELDEEVWFVPKENLQPTGAVIDLDEWHGPAESIRVNRDGNIVES